MCGRWGDSAAPWAVFAEAFAESERKSIFRLGFF